MSKAAQSVLVFGIYLAVLGPVLIVAPNMLLGLFGMIGNEVWIRVVGVLVVALALYYIQAARHELREFFKLTVYGRVWVLVAFVAFVLLGYVSPALILFGAVDALGGLWTALALRKR